MTPCEKLGYKAGDKFTVKGSKVFEDGSIIELDYDDGSESPSFNLISGSNTLYSGKINKSGAFCLLGFVQKIEEKEMTHQKEPHRHAEMMKAYADDVSLIVFCNGPFGRKWHVIDQKWPSFNEDFDCFLCLPRHKEAVLNMLNGGESQIKPAVGWINALNDDVEKWNPNYWYMLDDYESRIKPKKEKRWIGFMKDNTVVNEHFSSKDELLHYTLKKYTKEYSKTLSAHEIEVEV